MHAFPERFRILLFLIPGLGLTGLTAAFAQRPVKPLLHGTQWVAIAGKPPAATAGAMIFAQGG
jgi:gamma-glutamyltranspeptidase/glutathione hydrolase